jgi:hypothetical protein
MPPQIAQTVQAWRASRQPALVVSRAPLTRRGGEAVRNGTRAFIGLALRAPAVDVSRVPGYEWHLSVVLTVTERAGVGAQLTCVRMEMYSVDGTLLESVATGAGIFGGGNRLDAGLTREFLVQMGFDADPLAGRSVLISVGAVDDNGHDHQLMSQRLTF